MNTYKTNKHFVNRIKRTIQLHNEQRFYHMILNNIYTEENNRLHPGWSEQNFTTIADKTCLLMPYTVLFPFQNINQITKVK